MGTAAASRSHGCEGRPATGVSCVARRCSSNCRGPETTVWFLSALPQAAAKRCCVRSWLEDGEISEHTAWVAVEPRERDAQHFWLTLTNALAAALGGSVEPLGPTPGFRGEAVVERLLEDLRSLEEPLVLVIDDLHELESPEGLTWLELLIARRPAGLRIVLTSRSEPDLNVHRLRLAGELTEIREAELRFSAHEAAKLLRAGEMELSDEAVTMLHERRKVGPRASAWRRFHSPGIRTRSGSCATSPAASAPSRDI